MNLELFLIVVAVKVLNSLLPLHSINIRVLNGSISQIKKSSNTTIIAFLQINDPLTFSDRGLVLWPSVDSWRSWWLALSSEACRKRV